MISKVSTNGIVSNNLYSDFQEVASDFQEVAIDLTEPVQDSVLPEISVAILAVESGRTEAFYQSIRDFMATGPSQADIDMAMAQYGVSKADVDVALNTPAVELAGVADAVESVNVALVGVADFELVDVSYASF